jgi:hypothetical protein
LGVGIIMSNSLSKDFGLVDGQTYTIGRKSDVYKDNYIYIDSPDVSRQHAAIKIKNGKVYLCDLNSTNGTYLLDNGNLLEFEEGYLSPNQPIVIGGVRCTIQSLLATCGVYSAVPEITTDFLDTTKLMIPTTRPHETGDPNDKSVKR